MNAPDGGVLNQHPVEIVHHGWIISGVYRTWAGLITVTAASGAIKTTSLGDKRPNLLARIMLRELVQEERA